jgi:hypothetical protein
MTPIYGKTGFLADAAVLRRRATPPWDALQLMTAKS